MVGLLIGLIFLVLINIVATLLLFQLKQNKADTAEDTGTIYESMGKFVADLEKENNELYQKLVNYIKEKERKLDVRIADLEEKLNCEDGKSGTGRAEPLGGSENVEEQADDLPVGKTKQGMENVLQLSKQGFSPKQIAKVLQMDNGEVELVVNMAKTKQGFHK